MRERDLYPPVKSFLEAQGYQVKGEVDGCDVVAIRDQEPPVIVELKTAFSLALVFQGIARQGLSDNVYLAVPPFSGRMVRPRDPLGLCRRLGLGLLTVRLEPTPFVEALLDPAPYRPRKRTLSIGGLLREFQRRVGDPNEGGSSRRSIMTAYRQDALRCAAHLGHNGPTKAAVVVGETGVDRAGGHHARRSLWLVQTRRRYAARDLRPDPEGPSGAQGICGCRGGAGERRRLAILPPA